MKRYILPLLIAPLFFMASCEEGADTEGKTRVVQDSLINVLPNWQALKIKVDDNNTHMKVVVGDASFYTVSPDVKKQKADDLAKMVLRIYGQGNHLEKGELIVTKDVKNTSENPADGISIPMDFDGIKKSSK